MVERMELLDMAATAEVSRERRAAVDQPEEHKTLVAAEYNMHGAIRLEWVAAAIGAVHPVAVAVVAAQAFVVLKLVTVI